MIISSRPVVELVPVQPASMDGRYICQWDKDSCDDARFIKIDFLALGMLSLVEECLELIWECAWRKAGREHDRLRRYRRSTTRSAMATPSACSRSKVARRSRC